MDHPDLGLASFKIPASVMCVWENVHIETIILRPKGHLTKEKIKKLFKVPNLSLGRSAIVEELVPNPIRTSLDCDPGVLVFLIAPIVQGAERKVHLWTFL